MTLEERKKILKDLGYNVSDYSDEEIMTLNPEKLKLASEGKLPEAKSVESGAITQVDSEEPEMFLEEAAPIKGRFLVKNLSGEDSEAAIQYLARENPGFQFTTKDGRIFARAKGEKNWKALDPSSFELADISDVAYDVGSGLAQTAGMIAAGLPTGGLGGAIAGGAAGYGAEKLREKLGELAGVRGPEEKSGAVPAAVIGAAVPAAGVAVRGAGKQISKLPGIESLTGIPGDIYKRLVTDRGFNEYAKRIATNFDEMQEAIKSFTEPVLEEFRAAKKIAGETLKKTLNTIDKELIDRGYDGVSTKNLYKVLQEKLRDLTPSIKTPEAKEQVQAVKDFIKSNFYDSKGNKFDFMTMNQLQDLKEVVRSAANFDVSTSQIKPGVAKRLDSLAKAVENEITKMQDATVSQVLPEAKQLLAQQRKQYAKLLKEEELLAPLENPNFYTQASSLPKSSRTQLRSLINKYIKGLPNEEEIKRSMDAVALSRIGQEERSLPSTLQGLLRSTIANPTLVSGASGIGGKLTMPNRLRDLLGPTGRRFGLITGSTMLREMDE